MVDEITPKSGENGAFLSENSKNEAILEVFGNFGCKVGTFFGPGRG